jgi:Rieske Fe-S protein
VGDVPVGGGIILDVRDGVVVTQPTAGQIMAFSAVCPHEGCVISEVAGGEMICPCHGSRFRVADGVVTHGPATRNLARVTVTVVDGVIAFPRRDPGQPTVG